MPIKGRYQIQAKPITRRLIDIEIDALIESIDIISRSIVEFNIMVLIISDKHVDARNRTNQPDALKMKNKIWLIQNKIVVVQKDALYKV